MPKQGQTTKQEKYYVYSLSNPITNKVFYIGKGCGDRINAHEMEAKTGKGCNKEKLNIINNILKSGQSVTKRIIRRFNDESKAYKYETLLIRTIKGLTNILSSQKPRKKLVSLSNLIIKIVNRKVDRCYALRHLNKFYNSKYALEDHKTLIVAVKSLANKNNWLTTECAYAK